MARTTRASANAQNLSSPPATPLAGQGKKVSAAPKSNGTPVTPANTRKRARKAIKQEDFDVNDLPHNLGTALPTPGADADHEDDATPPKKRAKSTPKNEEDVNIKDEDDELKTEIKTPKKGKKANYGLTPGISPFPDYARPTPDPHLRCTNTSLI